MYSGHFLIPQVFLVVTTFGSVVTNHSQSNVYKFMDERFFFGDVSVVNGQ